MKRSKSIQTAHNKRYTLRRLFGGSGSAKHQSGYALCGILLHHIFTVAGMLRIPLSQPQKRRIPRTLCEIWAKWVWNILTNILKSCILLFIGEKMEIIYKDNVIPEVEQIIDVYNSSGINRPTMDKNRIEKMFSNSNLIITAWDKENLVGISRSLTDFCYCCYLSDLAVKKEYQTSGIGKKLIELTRNSIGKQTALILLSSPTAMDYYPKVGFLKIDNGFIIKRKE